MWCSWVLVLGQLSVINWCTLNVINRTRLSHNCLIVFATIYCAVTVASGCYHCDCSVTYVSYAIVSIAQTFVLPLCIWKTHAVSWAQLPCHFSSRRYIPWQLHPDMWCIDSCIGMHCTLTAASGYVVQWHVLSWWYLPWHPPSGKHVLLPEG